MSDRKYIGITIGPILQTLEEAGTPAALWFASSYFSDLTRRICQALTIHMEGIQIYSPYYSETTVDNDGVGKYHDRIIFSADPFDEAKLREIIAHVKEDSLENFIFMITTLIISKKPGNTGFSRDIRTEFTTDLLLSD